MIKKVIWVPIATVAALVLVKFGLKKKGVKKETLSPKSAPAHVVAPVPVEKSPAEKAKGYITSHLSEALTAESVALALGIDVALLTESLGASSVEKLLLQARIKSAKKLLTTTTETNDSLATTLGFTSGKQFSTAFKSATGITPSAYRKENSK